LRPVVRFAPSPSGYLHVGGARTAIFNWLIAKKEQGSFLLRIEDTDRKRSTQASIDQIITSLQWLGIDWDGDVVYQSQRLQRHRAVAQNLLEEKKAYRCFCSKTDLAARRTQAEKSGMKFLYDRRCLHLTQNEIDKNLEKEIPYVFRLNIGSSAIMINDLIHGRSQIDHSTLDDFIIQREDGTPTYQLAVVADDHDMGITLVVRGDDHLSNTPKQILLYKAMGWDQPEFAHIPLILGPDKVRLSKRHGATSIEEFRDQGILPEALFNYLCLLGWSPGDDNELLERSKLVNVFSKERINKSAAVFDFQKLKWMNRQYLAKLPLVGIKKELYEYLERAGLKILQNETEKFDQLIELYKQRTYTINELQEKILIFFNSPQIFDAKGVRKFFNSDGLLFLKSLSTVLYDSGEAVWSDLERLEMTIRGFAEKNEVSAGKIIHPLRLALTGNTESPGIFEMLYILGRKKVIDRIELAIRFAEQDANPEN